MQIWWCRAKGQESHVSFKKDLNDRDYCHWCLNVKWLDLTKYNCDANPLLKWSLFGSSGNNVISINLLKFYKLGNSNKFQKDSIFSLLLQTNID